MKIIRAVFRDKDGLRNTSWFGPFASHDKAEQCVVALASSDVPFTSLQILDEQKELETAKEKIQPLIPPDAQYLADEINEANRV